MCSSFPANSCYFRSPIARNSSISARVRLRLLDTFINIALDPFVVLTAVEALMIARNSGATSTARFYLLATYSFLDSIY